MSQTTSTLDLVPVEPGGPTPKHIRSMRRGSRTGSPDTASNARSSIIQNTGMMESVETRCHGWGIGMNTPVVMMVGYRGWTAPRLRHYRQSPAF